MAAIDERWDLQLLGCLRARQGERLVTRFRTQSTGALLGYLAYYKGRSHPREVLIELLWPEIPPEKGRHNLSNALSSLRNQLEPPGVPAGAVVIADRLSVELNPAAVSTDVEAFEQALRRAAQTKGTTPAAAAERAEHLAQALEQYGGFLLPGYYDEWITREGERLADRFVDATLQLVRHLEANGAADTALEYARRAVSVDPLSEQSNRDVIRLLLARGETAAAQRQYGDLEKRLRETDEEPSPETRLLLLQMPERITSKPENGREAALRSPQTSVLSVPSLLPLPGGTVTFLVVAIDRSHVDSDVPTSDVPTLEAFDAFMERCNGALRIQFSRNGGHVVEESSGSFAVAFARASDAFTCALEGQKALAAELWRETAGHVFARMALHTGEVTPGEGGSYRSPVLHLATRILAAGHGGQILCSAATAELLRRDPGGDDSRPGLVDLGLYRLRPADPGREQPERLFLVQSDGAAPGEYPPPGAERADASGSMPPQFTRFFGRDKEISRIQEMLVSPEVRLLTLTGSGGTGKTRLAIEAAGGLMGRFAGAVWFVPLADLADASGIGGAVIQALRLPPGGSGADPFEQAVGALSKRPSLLVFDNFEHVVTGGGAEFVQTLLARVPNLTILVTSRQVLQVEGERVFTVEPLPTPNGNGHNNPQQLSLFEAVRLFVDRAQAVKPDFQITTANAPAVAELCDRLEGIPLAIELAAARAQVLTPQQQLSLLGSRFELLVSRKKGVVARQRTLRSTIDWSYQLLDEDLRRFFARLSVFRGGWTAEAAEAVCDEPEHGSAVSGLALDYLAQLRECSLVLSEQTDDEMRFRMLETLREFADEQLSNEERVLLRQRHWDCFLERAESTPGSAAQGWIKWEQDNVRAALEWALSPQGNYPQAGRLAVATFSFWFERGHWTDLRRWLGAALEMYPDQDHLRAFMASEAGIVALFQTDLTRAHALFVESQALFRSQDDLVGAADSLKFLSSIALYRNDFTEQRRFLEEALAVFRSLGHTHGTASTLESLGDNAQRRGDAEEARSLYEQSIALFEAIGEWGWVARVYSSMGQLSVEQGEYHEAITWHERAIAICRRLAPAESHRLADNLSLLSVPLAHLGAYDEARQTAEEGVAVARASGDKGSVLTGLRCLGLVAHFQTDFPQAEVAYTECLLIRRELGDKRGVVDALLRLGQAAYSAKEYAAARTFFTDGLALCQEGRGWESVYQSSLLVGLGGCDIHDRRFPSAHACLAEAVPLARSAPSSVRLTLLEEYAALYAATDQPERAARLLAAGDAFQQEKKEPRDPPSRRRREALVNLVRDCLDATTFAASQEAGHALTWEQAIDTALEMTSTPPKLY